VSDVKVDPIIPDGYFEKTQEYQQKSLEMLQSINENTANLYTMVELINQNNEKQDELLALMTEILSLAKAKSKADAETLFKKIMGKINDTTDNVDTMIKIVGWATAVYNMVQSMLP
jgi:predicted house-cleaning NTP pyrophosphatase (Maf/HAM1 superfamily)